MKTVAECMEYIEVLKKVSEAAKIQIGYLAGKGKGEDISELLLEGLKELEAYENLIKHERIHFGRGI